MWGNTLSAKGSLGGQTKTEKDPRIGKKKLVVVGLEIK